MDPHQDQEMRLDLRRFTIVIVGITKARHITTLVGIAMGKVDCSAIYTAVLQKGDHIPQHPFPSSKKRATFCIVNNH